jgi:predicted aspartyl protease
MFPFDGKFDPPALTIPVKVAGVVRTRPRTALLALIDTGADITAIPDVLKDRYQLYPIGRLQLEGVAGITSIAYTYEANMTALDQPARPMKVVLTHFPFVILGRDWLRHYHIYVDGPGSRFAVRPEPFEDLPESRVG